VPEPLPEKAAVFFEVKLKRKIRDKKVNLRQFFIFTY
jgi:hypothetical protein